MSKDTHAKNGMPYHAIDIVKIALQHRQNGALIVSGGEPTDQPKGLAELLQLYRNNFPASPIQVYTGRTLNWVKRYHPYILVNIDALIANPFKRERSPTALTGSNNQVVHLLSNRGKEYFSDWQNWPRKLQMIQTQDDRAIVIGIPDREIIQNIQLMET